jgi:hypothetical protein
MEEDNQKAAILMTAEQRLAAGAISFIAATFIALRFWCPRLPIDTTTISLLGIGVIPWLTLFFKSFNFPGIGGAETRYRASGFTKPQRPSSATAPITPALQEVERIGLQNRFRSLPEPAKKVLRTLWRYQRQNCEDYATRWTFAILQRAGEFPDYLEGLAILLRENLVTIGGEKNMCALTDEGIVLMSSLSDAGNGGDIYFF